jgi:glycerol-3-phosphate dehydrogenase
MLNKADTLRHEPLLKPDGLKGSGLYYEYRTDDARLTLDIMKTAWRYGAKIVNYTELTEFIYRDGRVVGVRALDRVSGRRIELYAKKIVNAAGPWVDGVRKLDGSLQGKRLFLTKGVHLVVDHARLPVAQSAYFDTPDGRMVFVIPRGKITYIGTTDTAYSHSVDLPRTTEEDRAYLIRAVNFMFPSVKLAESDILSHWAGLRPLIYEEGKGPSELSRKDEIFISDSGLITIAGGKLTGFRKMAEKVVDLVGQQLAKAGRGSLPGCTTDQIVISGGECKDRSRYAEWKQEMLQMGAAKGVDPAVAGEWIETYGTNTLHIYERLQGRPSRSQGYSRKELLAAQLAYSIEEEMTVQAVDFLRLRTGWTYFDLRQAEENADAVIALMAEMLDWDSGEAERQRAEVNRFLDTIYHLPKNDQELAGIGP